MQRDLNKKLASEVDQLQFSRSYEERNEELEVALDVGEVLSDGGQSITQIQTLCRRLGPQSSRYSRPLLIST